MKRHKSWKIIERICEARIVRPANIADRLKISRAAVSRWKKNGVPLLQALRLAEIYNVRVDSILKFYKDNNDSE